MPFDFYASPSYREKQKLLTKAKWKSGFFNFLHKREKRVCKRPECAKTFEVIPCDPKIYCGKSCAAIVNNAVTKKGVRRPMNVRLKIAQSLKGRASPLKGSIRVPSIEIICASPRCKKVFFRARWMSRKFCSNQCAMSVIGGKPTSPRAARGKAGIREDIHPSAYFYSRWEANIARLFNFFGMAWVHQPATFDIGAQNYTPDFYLPQLETYIEVKNFLGAYSQSRDERFRKLYPHIKLTLLLKEEYKKLEIAYAPFIKNWEYKNSKFER